MCLFIIIDWGIDLLHFSPAGHPTRCVVTRTPLLSLRVPVHGLLQVSTIHSHTSTSLPPPSNLAYPIVQEDNSLARTFQHSCHGGMYGNSRVVRWWHFMRAGFSIPDHARCLPQAHFCSKTNFSKLRKAPHNLTYFKWINREVIESRLDLSLRERENAPTIIFGTSLLFL